MGNKQTTKTVSSIALGRSLHSVEPKTIAAVVLVAVMGVLWVRVLMRSDPNTASAAAKTEMSITARQENSRQENAIRPVPLNVVIGRHDMVAEDIFNAKRCSVWNKAIEPVAVVESPKQEDNQRLLNELIKGISLEAIIKNATGVAEKACINGVIVGAGSNLPIQVKKEIYTVRIVAIESDHVQIVWQDHSVAIEIPDQKVN